MTTKIDTHKLFATGTDGRCLRVERTDEMVRGIEELSNEMPSVGRRAEYVVLALGVDGEQIDEVWLGNDPDPIRTLTEAMDVLQGALEALARVERVNQP